MKKGYEKTAHRLWQTAPYWRASVIGAAFFTVLSIIHVLSGTRALGRLDATPALLPAPTRDPAIEARLADYDAASSAAKGSKTEGEHCETLATAFGKLSPVDLQEGRSVIMSTKSRIASLTEGRRCEDMVSESDQRFEVLNQAAAADAVHPGADAAREMATAYGRLSPFDHERSRFAAEQNIVLTAQREVEIEKVSDARLAALSASVTALKTDHGAAAYLRAANALRELTDYDRAHPETGQSEIMAAADQAAVVVGASKGRLAQISSLLEAAKSDPSPETDERLIVGVAKISRFDETFETPAEAEALATARSVATPLAWQLLKTDLNNLAKDGSVENYSAVSSIYELLQNAPQPAEGEDRRLLERARAAADFLPISDTRIALMRQAAAAWKEQGIGAKGEVLAAFKAITDFDQKRFDPSLEDDWSLIKRAASIVRGPDLGLTVANRDQMPIFVSTTSAAELDHKVVGSLVDALRDAGYRVADKRADAALLTQVSIGTLSEPQLVSGNGAIADYEVVASLNVVTRWISDDTVLFSGPVSATTIDPSSVVTKNALLKGIAAIVARFQQTTVK